MSGSDGTVTSGLSGIFRNRFRCPEVQVTLDRQSKSAAHCSELSEADAAELGAPEPQIAEAGGVGILDRSR